MKGNGTDTLIVTGIITALVAIVVSPILYGWVSTYLWLWFVAPLGLAPISTTHAIGLSLLARILVLGGDTIPPPKSDNDGPGTIVYRLIGAAFVRPMLTLLVGWVIYQFM